MSEFVDLREFRAPLFIAPRVLVRILTGED